MHKPGWGFYVLRHVFRTVADETRDQVAVDAIMGHATPGMDTVYRERISGDRLRALVDHVHGWVFGAPTTEDDRETDAPRLRLYAG